MVEDNSNFYGARITLFIHIPNIRSPEYPVSRIPKFDPIRGGLKGTLDPNEVGLEHMQKERQAWRQARHIPPYSRARDTHTRARDAWRRGRHLAP